MSFREINHKNNEEYWERLELVMERIEAVSEEEASSVEELYRGYFFEMSELFLVLYKLAEASLSGKLAEISTLEREKDQSPSVSGCACPYLPSHNFPIFKDIYLVCIRNSVPSVCNSYYRPIM